MIDETAKLKLDRRDGVTYVQSGPVTGTLAGEMVLRATIGGPGVTATFSVVLSDGTLRGRGQASLRPKRDGSSVDFSGTASITSGTGAYARASARSLRYTGNVAADGSTSTVHLNGELHY